jgi:hypothetical protein
MNIILRSLALTVLAYLLPLAVLILGSTGLFEAELAGLPTNHVIVSGAWSSFSPNQ